MPGLRFDVQKRLGSFELDAAAEFSEGITGIFGGSGSGKTTLLKSLAGFITPDRGKVSFNETVYFSSEKGFSAPLEERRIAMVWQEALLFPHLNVEENVLYGCRKDCPVAFRNGVMGLLEIPRLARRMPRSLSGGEKQRVAIARSLLHEPRLLLMDEPVASLDLQTRQKIISYLKTIHWQLDIPVVYVSHSVSELMFLAQHVLVLEGGRCVRYDLPERIFINEKQLSRMEEDFENIVELPVLRIGRDEKIVDLDLGGVTLKTVFHDEDSPQILRVGIKAKDILIATEQVTGISARNKMAAVIEKIEPAGDVVMLSCRVNTRRFWVEITPGAFRELKLHLLQLVYLLIKATSIRVLR